MDANDTCVGVQHITTTVSCYLLQKITNVVVGILTFSYLYPMTPFVVGFTLGSSFALIGFVIALFTTFKDIWPDTLPLFLISWENAMGTCFLTCNNLKDLLRNGA